ncbi:hypothetical protein [Roseovarius arcticus]|uniref:hypothetical protein n=1 Tax=Roseovarius arcticus TaxID=2547404 RepID=UPI0011104E3F|nr:hypothetical protein [Roseovarius arcticus]
MQRVLGQGHPDGNDAGSLPPGFEDAAAALGISADALMQAMAQAGGPRADLAAVAAALEIEEEDLRAALPPPPN